MRTRTLPAVLAGAVVAAIVTGSVVLPQFVGNGVTVIPPSASPSLWPGDLGTPPRTLPRTPAGEPTTAPPSAEVPARRFGTGMLLQTDDFSPLGLTFAEAQQRDDGLQRLSACTGDQTMADVTSGDAGNDAYTSAVWRSTDSATLSESVSRGVTTKAAHRYVRSLIDELTGCRYRQHGRDRHLGSPTTIRTETGRALRFVAYDADQNVIGGVVVFQDGKDFGVFELLGAGTDEPADTLDALAIGALRRIA